MSNESIPPRVNEHNDLNDLSPAELISRITALETQLKTTTAQLKTLANQAQSPPDNSSLPALAPAPEVVQPATKVKKPPKAFDPSVYATRHIALKFSYIGTSYNGFEHTNNVTSAPTKPTIEEVLWKALRKVRLISPTIPQGADQSYEVVWDERARAERYGVGMEGMGRGKRGKERLELVWDNLAYSKCGRTDKGVSAFGQVIGITVRSSKPTAARRRLAKSVTQEEVQQSNTVDVSSSVVAEETADIASGMREEKEQDEDGDGHGDGNGDPAANWHPVRDELPYISMLNSVLPPTIRILAWAPDPSSTFDARFSCKERRYKYFFTNPALCPTPGKPGMAKADGTSTAVREGWLDIEATRKAAKKLEGLHDFRNLCKIDPSKQMSSCERRISFADIEEFNDGMDAFVKDARLNQSGSTVNGFINNLANLVPGQGDGPKVYTFTVHGTAFLWHQVRCMVAVLFLVGQGLEKPEVVDQLLDITAIPGKPQYEMADDAPLVLWDCIFPGDDPGDETGMPWIYAGDEATLSTVAVKGDGKFGASGLVEQLWTQWRDAKIAETLNAGLLGLVLEQGDGLALDRGGQRDPEDRRSRSQKVFEGSGTPRLAGEYVPVLQKPRKQTLEEQNAKYAAGKQYRRDFKRQQDHNDEMEL